ncbi:hypothetical protein WJX73_003138 [Symbiochloris irregularis]|uniref:Condensation domain-containing protein n=1 Tax=Symbiochloris irregularis TaxID=706552 RepID=A0AAW1P159_9CHLO
MKEAEAVVERLKRALVLHYLTCGMWSRIRSGGMFSGCCGGLFGSHSKDLMGAETKGWGEGSGGVSVPELASRTSTNTVTLRKLLTHLSSVNFRLTEVGLLRATLIKVAEDQHIFLLVLHHTLTDGWSTSIICKDMSAAYNAFVNGQIPDLPRMPIQYADFAGWQRKWLHAGNMKTQLKYWRERLQGGPIIWSFPLDRPRPPVPTGAGRRVHCSLTPASVRALRKLAIKAQATMFMAILTAYKALLIRYCQEDELVVGVPYAGRNRAETEGLMGAFLGAVALRTPVKDAPSFNKLLKRVREIALSAFENADTPLHLVMVDVMGLGNMAGAAAPPLFQAMFFLHDSAWLEGFALDGITNDVPRRVEKNVARHDLTLELTMDNAKDEVVGHLEYRADLFDHGTATRFIQHLQLLIDAITAQPDTSIWDLVFMSQEELRLVHKFAVPPAGVIPEGREGEALRPCIFDKKGQMLPPGIPGQLVLLPFDVAAHEAEHGPLVKSAPRQSHDQLLPVEKRPSFKTTFSRSFRQLVLLPGRPSEQKLGSHGSKPITPPIPQTPFATDSHGNTRGNSRQGTCGSTPPHPLQVPREANGGAPPSPRAIPSPFSNDSLHNSGELSPRVVNNAVDHATPSSPRSRTDLKESKTASAMKLLGLGSLVPQPEKEVHQSGAVVDLSGARSKLLEASSPRHQHKDSGSNLMMPSPTPQPSPLLASPPSLQLPKRSIPLRQFADAVDTGYIAKCDQDGIFTVLGRLENQVQMEGYLIQLESIEAAIRAASPQVSVAAVAYLPDPSGTKTLVAYVSPANVDIFALDLALRSSLPQHLIPTLFNPVGELRLLHNGEVNRRALPRPNWTVKLRRSYVAPRNKTEMEVQLIWQAVLNKQEMISTDADFSELGGNMMHAVIANGIVREVMGARMPALKLFEDRTIQNVAARISTIKRRTKHKPKGEVTLSDLPFLQQGFSEPGGLDD